MNSLLLVVLVSCPPIAAYPDAGPAYGDSNHQRRPRLFSWLRVHHHDNKCPCAGNGHAGGSWPPVAAAPAVEADTVEAVIPEPTRSVVLPPASTGPASRLVPYPQPVTTSAEPPLAAQPDGAPRPMPQGPMAPTGAEPPRTDESGRLALESVGLSNW
jgi:hypothetical protein